MRYTQFIHSNLFSQFGRKLPALQNINQFHQPKKKVAQQNALILWFILGSFSCFRYLSPPRVPLADFWRVCGFHSIFCSVILFIYPFRVFILFIKIAVGRHRRAQPCKLSFSSGLKIVLASFWEEFFYFFWRVPTCILFLQFFFPAALIYRSRDTEELYF